MGSVELDENNDVVSAKLNLGGEILVNYNYGMTNFSGISMTRNENGDPVSSMNTMALGQSSYIGGSNNYGIIFKGANGLRSGTWISFRNNQARTKFWKYYKNLKKQFINQF